MKILVLVSGGDAPGINKFLFELNNAFKDCFAVVGGFRGLIDNNIVPLSSFNPKIYQNEAGAIIKSSRCPEFKEEKYFKKALANAKKFDCLVILGGNGSAKGAKELQDNGMRTIFVPCTIDNDVDGSDYSIGYHSAVMACNFVIENIMPSMEAFNRCCVFEVMGRKCDAIAKAVANMADVDYLIANEVDLDYKKIVKVIKDKYKKGHASSIVLRENITNIQTLCQKLEEESKVTVKYNVIGHIQRGFKPTKLELKNAKAFAVNAIKAIKNSEESHAVLMKKGKIVIEKL